jgi:hypothetical protein
MKLTNRVIFHYREIEHGILELSRLIQEAYGARRFAETRR